MEEIIYVPISQENEVRRVNQKQLAADYLSEGWKHGGFLELKDSLGITVKVIVLQKVE